MTPSIDIIYILIVIIVILLSMTLHEAMHAYSSFWLGDDTARLHGRLSFNPIKHIDPFMTILLPILLAISGGPIFGGAKPVPFNPNLVKGGEWGAALVAIAGPLTNLVMAFVSYGMWYLLALPDGNIISQFLSIAVMVNLGFFIFNLIPIPPLDGSRVLYALAPDFARNIMERMESFGIIIVFMILLLAGDGFQLVFSSAVKFFVNYFHIIFSLAGVV